jgi:hypothetical protein
VGMNCGESIDRARVLERNRRLFNKMRGAKRAGLESPPDEGAVEIPSVSRGTRIGLNRECSTWNSA